MKKIVGLLCAMTGTAFALDERPVLGAGVMELQAGYMFQRITGFYDSQGEFYDWEDIGIYPEGYEPGATAIPLQFKYGLGGGMDVTLELMPVFTNEDNGDRSGLDQPSVGLKYAGKTVPATFFADLTLPFATGDFDAPDLPIILEAGVLMHHKAPSFRFSGLVGYAIDDEGDGIIHLMGRPGIMLNRTLEAYLRGDLGLGQSGDATDGHLFAMAPGAILEVSKGWSLEGSYQFTVAGENTFGVRTFRVDLRRQLPP